MLRSYLRIPDCFDRIYMTADLHRATPAHADTSRGRYQWAEREQAWQDAAPVREKLLRERGPRRWKPEAHVPRIALRTLCSKALRALNADLKAGGTIPRR